MANNTEKKTGENIVPFAGDNKAKPADVARFITDIEAVQKDIDKVMSDAREACAPHRDNIKKIKLDAHEATNVARASMNHVLAARRSALKVAQRASRLSAEHRKAAKAILKASPEQADLF